MSRFRNRNIRNKFFVPPVGQKHREVSGTADSGIDVKQQPAHGEFGNGGYMRGLPSCSSSEEEEDSDMGIIEEGLDTKGSSASSLSWGDDYELQATEMVKDEYERMDRVLQRLEPIPQHYDKDEYKLWIRMFPCLSLTGPTSSLPQSNRRRPSNTPSSEENLVVLSPKEDSSKLDCDKATSSLSVSKNPTVINKLLEELHPNQKYKHSTNTTVYSNELAVNNTINPRTLDIAFGSFLQIAPVALPKKPARELTSKSNDFLLPNMHFRRKFTPSYSNTNSHSKSKHRLDFIVLPPIDINRSISANLNQVKSHSETLLSQSAEVSNEDHVDFFVGRRGTRRKSRFVKLLQD